jgi:hypothetical protein
MPTTTPGFIARNSVFAWIAFSTCLALTIPLVAMQFTAAVDWSAMDFAVMGTLLFVTGSLFVLVARRVPRKYQVAVAIAFAALFLYAWAELAVGVFTNLGS